MYPFYTYLWNVQQLKYHGHILVSREYKLTEQHTVILRLLWVLSANRAIVIAFIGLFEDVKVSTWRLYSVPYNQ